MSEADEKMAAARAMVIFKAPFFASAVYGFVFHPVEGVRTMFLSTKLVLGYDPQWATTAPVSKLAADIYHEVHHFVRRHFFRILGGGYDLKLGNIAGDLAINPDEIAAGWDLDESALLPEHYGFPNGLTMEEYIDRLRKLQQEQDDPTALPQPKQGGQKKQQASGGGGAPPPKQKKEQQPPQQPSAGGGGAGGDEPKKEPGIASGCCGSFAGNSAHPEIEAMLDGITDLGRTPTEIKNIEKRVAADIKEHAEKHGRGSLPRELLETIERMNEPSYVRWEDELAYVIRDTTGRVQAGGEDYSLARPAKRALMWGVVRSGMIERLPEVAIIRDSSMSMGQKQLTACCREAYAVCQALGIDEVWFADADTDISCEWRRVGAEFFKNLTDVYGRGGTDFRKPLESARKLMPHPDIILYATDGDGTAPKDPPPDTSVIWCVVPSRWNKSPARWGHTVMITDDPHQRVAPIQYPDDVVDVDDADDDDPSFHGDYFD